MLPGRGGSWEVPARACLGQSHDVFKFKVVPELRRLVGRQARLPLAFDQCRNPISRRVGGPERSDAAGRAAGGDEVNDLFVGTGHSGKYTAIAQWARYGFGGRCGSSYPADSSRSRTTASIGCLNKIATSVRGWRRRNLQSRSSLRICDFTCSKIGSPSTAFASPTPSTKQSFSGLNATGPRFDPAATFSISRGEIV